MDTIQAESLKFDWVVFGFILGIHMLAVIGLVCGMLGYIPNFFSLINIIAFFVIYYITGCLGITLGYHRLITHQSFSTTPFFEFILAICGMLALQSNPVTWASDHRIHHNFSDTVGDKHDSNKGFFWSHIGWLFYKQPVSEQENRIRTTLLRNAVLRLLNSDTLMVLLQITLAGLLYLVGGLGMVVWGVLIRIVFVWHATWLINSATHKWGYKWFQIADNSKNNWWTALLTFGEGWHNTHHAHESSPKHGLAWWEVDITWWHILLLKKLRLVWGLKPIPNIPNL